jgi:hypothetical protein
MSDPCVNHSYTMNRLTPYNEEGSRQIHSVIYSYTMNRLTLYGEEDVIRMKRIKTVVMSLHAFQGAGAYITFSVDSPNNDR